MRTAVPSSSSSTDRIEAGQVVPSLRSVRRSSASADRGDEGDHGDDCRDDRDDESDCFHAGENTQGGPSLGGLQSGDLRGPNLLQ